ncbi:MAG: anaerobic ribonucleoside-triphosphate reductase activating protein [Clostridiaceae bacterium]|nr:anaerobic ribonucleoside-triphosphate reductase activating protein [Clostridiaceae bacterium]
MKIAGLQRTSFVDYPGKIAAVVFTPGCNLDCHYCHNRKLLSDETVTDKISPEDIFAFLKERQGFLDAVVVSGGEPTLQPGLEGFLSCVKNLGFNTKLDTNGTNPDIVKRLVDRNLIDYIAMDIKAPFDKYKDICGGSGYLDRIDQSIDLLMQGGIDYEFRTTFTPRLKEEDIFRIAGRIKGARAYALQQFRPVDENGERCFESQIDKPYSPEYIKKVVHGIKGLTQLCYVRGL